jgi:hypothetical protein
LKNQDIVSLNKFDLGQTNTHEIALKTKEPVYIQQFKIADTHQCKVERHVAEWLKLGIIQPTRSPFNSPIFAVAMTNGGIQLVQDFWDLNIHTHTDKYSMKEWDNALATSADLLPPYLLQNCPHLWFLATAVSPQARPYTVFRVSGQEQFQWVTTPMGLFGTCASFQRLKETVIHTLHM